VPVRLDVAFRQDANDWAIDAMSARLAEPTHVDPEFEPIWRGLWEIQRIEALSDLGSAGMACREYRLLEQTLSDKRRSPLAAAIATTVLLRCNALDYLHDWPRNLADWFPWLPDGAILWAETLVRRRDVTRISQRPDRGHSAQPKDESSKSVTALAMTPEYHEARAYFARLADRGSPLLRTSLSLAAGQVPFWRHVLDSGILEADDHHELLDACELIERTAKHLVSGGLFPGFVSLAGNLTPTEVLGRRKPVQNKRLRAA
jgi:hypothetical protein